MTASEKSKLCLACRYCCTVVTAPVYGGKSLPSEYVEFFAARKLKTIYDPTSGLHLVIVPHVCPHLSDEGCDLYLNHPKVCQIFDGRANAATREHCKWSA